MASEKKLKHLECIICIQVPEEKIFQCPSGHLLCEIDYIRWKYGENDENGHDFCPLCKIKLGDVPIRCIAAENTIEAIGIPCKNEGCAIHLNKVIKIKMFCIFMQA